MATLVKEKWVESLGIRCEISVPLGPLTWYGLGGCASCLVHPEDAQQLSILATRCVDEGSPLRVLGSGANLLVADEGVEGVVVQLDHANFKRVSVKGDRLIVGGGFDLPKLVLQTARQGLAGLHGLAGIPATVGGAVRMNAGGAWGQIGSLVRRVTVCTHDGNLEHFEQSDLMFAYRTSNIKAGCIVEVELEVTPDDPAKLMERVKSIFKKKKDSQPLASNSAGCAFKNPCSVQGSQGQVLSAGQLIDQAGLKGCRVGGAEVSMRHANFVIAHTGCTAKDVLALLNRIQQTVLERSGVQLEREVVFWT